jgi:hypothetical protein
MLVSIIKLRIGRTVLLCSKNYTVTLYADRKFNLQYGVIIATCSMYIAGWYI